MQFFRIIWRVKHLNDFGDSLVCAYTEKKRDKLFLMNLILALYEHLKAGRKIVMYDLMRALTRLGVIISALF